MPFSDIRRSIDMLLYMYHGCCHYNSQQVVGSYVSCEMGSMIHTDRHTLTHRVIGHFISFLTDTGSCLSMNTVSINLYLQFHMFTQ